MHICIFKGQEKNVKEVTQSNIFNGSLINESAGNSSANMLAYATLTLPSNY